MSFIKCSERNTIHSPNTLIDTNILVLVAVTSLQIKHPFSLFINPAFSRTQRKPPALFWITAFTLHCHTADFGLDLLTYISMTTADRVSI